MSETNQEYMVDAMRDNLSPEAIIAIIANLRPARITHPHNEDHVKAMRELEWFRETLMEIVGVREYNQIIDEIEL